LIEIGRDPQIIGLRHLPWLGLQPAASTPARGPWLHGLHVRWSAAHLKPPYIRKPKKPATTTTTTTTPMM
jgi:hypothetical protein